MSHLKPARLQRRHPERRATTGTVTLEDWETYHLPATTDAATLQPGQQVSITYDEEADGTMRATEVTPEA